VWAAAVGQKRLIRKNDDQDWSWCRSARREDGASTAMGSHFSKSYLKQQAPGAVGTGEKGDAPVVDCAKPTYESRGIDKCKGPRRAEELAAQKNKNGEKV